VKRSKLCAFVAFLTALMMTSSQGALAADTSVVEVVATEFGFSPSKVEVAAGSRVKIKLVNEGSLSHNLHIAEKGGATETIQTGKTDSIIVTAPESGKLGFFCNVPGHKQAGMKGALVVR